VQKIVPSAKLPSCFIDLRRAQAGLFCFIPAFDTSLLSDISGVWVLVPGWTKV